MADPTSERIAAALALAEAVDAAARACDLDGTPPELFQRTFLARCEALAAYRATAPKLRTRAERDRELGLLLREALKYGDGSTVAPFLVEHRQRLQALIREPLAPEPAAAGDAELADSVQVKTRSALAEATLAAHRYAAEAGTADEQLRELRSRLRNIYSLTHTYGTDPMAALLAIREASSPGA